MYSSLHEIKNNLIDEEVLHNSIAKNHTIILKGKKRNVALGENATIKVNTNIGVSEEDNYDLERHKLLQLCDCNYKPDTMMDHTIIALKKPFWKSMVDNFDGPIGTLPHYLAYDKEKGINVDDLLNRIEEMCAYGVAFMTMHPTANLELYEVASKSRLVPTTSRGGSILLSDTKINKRTDNIISLYFDDILNILKKYNVAISIGTVYRPANIFESLDKVHIEETRLQKKYIDRAKQCGVKVMMEGIGHISLDKISEYVKLKEMYNVPFMPLGPIPTDATIGFDHVAGAIGAAFFCMSGGASIINSITREEHTGGVPTINSILEGLKSARTAAHCVNLTKFERIKLVDKQVVETRSNMQTCAVSGGLFFENVSSDIEKGCKRCCHECPLTIMKNIN